MSQHDRINCIRCETFEQMYCSQCLSTQSTAAEEAQRALAAARLEISSLRQQLTLADAFHEVAIKEREFYRARLASVRDEAEKEVERLRKGRDGAQQTINKLAELLGEENVYDEVESLRSQLASAKEDCDYLRQQYQERFGEIRNPPKATP